MSSTAGKVDGEAYARQQAVARDVRETVADQLHDLIVERQGVGSPGEVSERVNKIGEIARAIGEARGRQKQAREMGLAVAVHVRAEREGLSSLRQAVASLGEACGSWCVALDIDALTNGDLGG